MSLSKPPQIPSPPAELLPPRRGVSHLAEVVRKAAQEQELPPQVARRYLDWIFLFVSWGLKAPPHRVSEARIGGFWDALSARGLPKGRVCEAMDALAFLFGAVGQPKRHLYPNGPPEGGAGPASRLGRALALPRQPS